MQDIAQDLFFYSVTNKTASPSARCTDQCLTSAFPPRLHTSCLSIAHRRMGCVALLRGSLTIRGKVSNRPHMRSTNKFMACCIIDQGGEIMYFNALHHSQAPRNNPAALTRPKIKQNPHHWIYCEGFDTAKAMQHKATNNKPNGTPQTRLETLPNDIMAKAPEHGPRLAASSLEES